MNEPDFSERVVIVTGAGKGTGQACAVAFARMGAKVVMSGRSREPLEETREQIAKLGAKSATFVGDVADQRTAEDTVALALNEYGRLDFAVNNAGISPWVGTTAERSIESWQQVISINLTGTWMGMKYQIPAMLENGGGAIVNMSSVNGVTAIPTIASYNASKGGIDQLTRAMALALADRGIRVNAVAPGTIATELAQKAVLGSAEAKARILSRTPLRRLGDPAEVAAVCAFLASDAASYMTGEVVYVDGGRLALNYTMPPAP
jgi:NAD(P)-dependent dehydrogenase (short-subunit alcohol dehydrogenase family)